MDNLGKSKIKYPHGGSKNIGNRKLKRNKVLLMLLKISCNNWKNVIGFWCFKNWLYISFLIPSKSGLG